ncbi:MAG TPA: hypothetical protein VEC93_21130, partial [Anaerolineae bacterium]|nr:hypothetical protein [Anaerolineae bacterium]
MKLFRVLFGPALLLAVSLTACSAEPPPPPPTPTVVSFLTQPEPTLVTQAEPAIIETAPPTATPLPVEAQPA